MQTFFSTIFPLWQSKTLATTRTAPAKHLIDPTPINQGNESIIRIEGLNCYYGNFKALSNVSLDIKTGKITAFIGASGCGKSTLLRTLNRINETSYIDFKTTGKVLYENTDIYDRSVDVCTLRKEVGMVFQKSSPFPKSIFDNVAFPLVISGVPKVKHAQMVEIALKKAALWEEVKNRLRQPALELSGGQQQRLCIARALALSPSVLLLDEPCSALDPGSTIKVEETIAELCKSGLSIVIVTHNMEQAKRVSEYTAFFYIDENEIGDRKPGKLIEFGLTEDLFKRPKEKRTLEFITGKFG